MGCNNASRGFRGDSYTGRPRGEWEWNRTAGAGTLGNFKYFLRLVADSSVSRLPFSLDRMFLPCSGLGREVYFCLLPTLKPSCWNGWAYFLANRGGLR
jgi:hypothetical protein